MSVAAALGSYIHGATSFATYVGNRTITASWVWWYLLRTPIGIALGIVLYFAIRGGLLSTGTDGSVLSPYGLTALSGMAGMFSKQASDKLQETFCHLFRTEEKGGDSIRRDKLNSHPNK